MDLILGLFGIVFIIMFGIMTFCLLFTCQKVSQFLVALCTCSALSTATYYAFKLDDTGAAPIVAGLLWMVGGIVLSSWLDYSKSQDENTNK